MMQRATHPALVKRTEHDDSHPRNEPAPGAGGQPLARPVPVAGRLPPPSTAGAIGSLTLATHGAKLPSGCCWHGSPTICWPASQGNRSAPTVQFARAPAAGGHFPCCWPRCRRSSASTVAAWPPRAAEGVTLRLRTALFDHIQWLTFRTLDKLQTGDLLQRSTSDVDANPAVSLSDQALEISAASLALFRRQPGGPSWSFMCRWGWYRWFRMPATVLISWWFFKRLERVYRARIRNRTPCSRTHNAGKSDGRCAVVKAFARQAHEIDKFGQENLKRFRLGRRMVTMYSLYWPCSDFAGALQQCGSAGPMAGYLVLN